MNGVKSKRSGFGSACCCALRTEGSAISSIAMKTSMSIVFLANSLRLRFRFEGLQLLNELMPGFRMPLGCKSLLEISVIGEKVSAQSVRDRLATRFVEQLGVSFVGESISGCTGDCPGV